MPKYRSRLLMAIFLVPGSMLYSTSLYGQGMIGQTEPKSDQVWKEKAKVMVKQQIESRGIDDKKVLDAMRNVPRHVFVPKLFRSQAYDDHPLPIAEQQTISQPYIVALMTDLLEIREDDKVLEIGTGSGYQAAVLSMLADSVYFVELIKALADSASSTLRSLGYRNIRVKWGDGYKGWPEFAPFDKIIVTAAPEQVPAALVDQLKPGGLLVIPVGKRYQELKLIRKLETGFESEDVIPVRFVPMVKPERPVDEY